MPNGALAPGKVLPKFCVPMNGFTSAVRSLVGSATAGVAAVPTAVPAASTTPTAAPMNDRILDIVDPLGRTAPTTLSFRAAKLTGVFVMIANNGGCWDF